MGTAAVAVAGAAAVAAGDDGDRWYADSGRVDVAAGVVPADDDDDAGGARVVHRWWRRRRRWPHCVRLCGRPPAAPPVTGKTPARHAPVAVSASRTPASPPSSPWMSRMKLF
uniref:Putative secreted protein n=1 Tax=Anopheles darlingi TaxID=43151 RepID=A0A2M4DRP2_ANODA